MIQDRTVLLYGVYLHIVYGSTSMKGFYNQEWESVKHSHRVSHVIPKTVDKAVKKRRQATKYDRIVKKVK